LFFFSSRRRHTRWPRDWSSDVCSSDLGELVVLELQDRSRWDRAEIEKGLALLDQSIRLKANRPASAYQLQAAIVALHAQAESPRSEERRVGKECKARGRPQH